MNEISWYGNPQTNTSMTTNRSVLCPDLLSIDDIGVADNLRGRVVRAFFHVIAWWKP